MSEKKRTKRQGQAMVEFAIISFVLTAMLAGFLGIIVLGLGSFQNNIAAESAGRLLDQHPALIKENFADYFSDEASDDYFDATTVPWKNITARQVYRFLNEYEIDENDNDRRLYDERRLIISRDDWDKRDELGLSAINESLLGQYIFDPDLEIDGQDEQGAYRFPGAVVQRTVGTETYQTVMIPLLQKPNETRGIDRSFNVSSSEPEMFYPVSDDWVAPVVVGKAQVGDAVDFRIIMFHPSQPASMMNVEVTQDADGNILSQIPDVADDAADDATIGEPPVGYVLAQATTINPLYGASSSRGKFGLGESYGFSQEVVDGELVSFFTKVRPYRAVFETSSSFRMTAAPIIVNTASLNIPSAEGSAPIGITTIAPIIIQYSSDPAPNTPIPLRDRTEVIETTDIAIDPPFDSFGGAYETELRDQSLDFETSVIFTPNTPLQRYFTDLPISPPASPDNDFVHNVLRLLPDDDGVWRVSVSAEFKRIGGMAWETNHELKLSLYKNGVVHRIEGEEAPIDRIVLDSNSPATILLENKIFIRAERGDVLQVRVFTDDGTDSPPPYDVELTGTPLTNWVLFERIGD